MSLVFSLDWSERWLEMGVGEKEREEWVMLTNLVKLGGNVIGRRHGRRVRKNVVFHTKIQREFPNEHATCLNEHTSPSRGLVLERPD